MDARVVFVLRTVSPIAFSNLVDGLRRAFHEFRETLGVVPVDEGESLVGKNDGGAAVDHVMDQHLPVAQAIAKRLDLVGSAKCEIVVRQPNARPFSLFQFGEQVCDVESRADVEIRLIEREKKLKYSASRPRGQVYVMGHRATIVLYLA